MHWRNATQQCCYPSSDRNSRLVSSLVEQIMIVLTVCGWSKDSAAEETLRQKFTLNLTDIVSQALRLNSLTTAGPTGEVEAVLIEPGQTFDSQRMVNDCPFESDSGTDQAPKFPPEDEIVCTTALGLKWADSTGDESDQVLLKPKVVLNGAFWRAGKYISRCPFAHSQHLLVSIAQIEGCDSSSREKPFLSATLFARNELDAKPRR
ncbi:hypothetical protein CPC08DRAFT_707106 [Agrocybe pediades]|nr:hypothetical protein CPC08DRAFT_707106 [Agrocybe pediades]